MLRRDFILRLVDHAVRLLHSLLGLVNLGRYTDALILLNDGYRQFFGMDSDTLVRLPISYLRDQIKDDAEGLVLMASLLEAEGDVLLLLENVEAAYLRWVLGVTLLLEVDAEGMKLTQPELPATIESIAKRLQPYALDATLNSSLFRYFAKTGSYALAENHLWEWVAADISREAAAAGQGFYADLLNLDDAALERGGLTREEIISGARGLWEKME
jgi:hypothetical protein